MSDYEKRVAALSPEQRRLLELRLQQQGSAGASLSAMAAQPPKVEHGAHTPTSADTLRQDLQFSLIFFSGDGSTTTDDKYQLVIDAARFADQHGFTGIWLPERHFHKFGGLYPSPSVLAAAIAMVTEQIHIRAGSVVLPLQHPARIVEEWSIVDNLSKGRIGVSFASGWVPDDFVLAAKPYAERRDTLFRNLEAVQSLWRGERVHFPTPEGQAVAVHTFPKPLQPELPIWITSSGNPETLVQAGTIGANLLTALLTQSVDEAADGIRVYRQARAEAGHPAARGHVTLMLHTFLWDQLDVVRQHVHGPLSAYLLTHLGMYANMAKNFDPQLDIERFSEADKQTLANYAFERYFTTHGLFGTPESCLPIIDRLQAIGVNEVACLIDFGIAPELMMRSLEYLNQLRELCQRRAASQAVPGVAGADAEARAL